MHVANHVGARDLSVADLTERANRFEWMRSALRRLLELPQITRADVLQELVAALRAGVISEHEVSTILAEITHDPDHIRAEMLARYKFTVHALVHLVTEQRRRAMNGGRA